jgi:hypothetical protein
MSERQANILAVTALVLLWALFFWRVLTPITADQASFKQGDFSGQFVTFGAYQYERFTAGEIPLWNPYNNSGLPFIGDTQAAVFYPPRLITIGLTYLSGGWSYHALQLEAIFHILAYSLLMYALAKRLTHNTFAALTASIVGSYGGYLSGYPPLQLALLEAGIWLPLVILLIDSAVSEAGVRWRYLWLAGAALGLSWMAGHPQTSWFLTYLSVAYLTFCLWDRSGWRWSRWMGGVALLGVVSIGTTAVTLLPGAEYLSQTARAGMGYATKTNGFPIQDIIQFLYPNIVSLFNPLYAGVTGLLLALAAFFRPSRTVWFWGGVGLFALLWAFGGNTALFDLLYNTFPGLRFFRGQERAAYLVANSLAILSGYGMMTLLPNPQHAAVRRVVRSLTVVMGGIAVALALLWMGFPDDYGTAIGPIMFSLLIVVAVTVVLHTPLVQSQQFLSLCLVGILILELFSVNMGADSNYDDIPVADQLALSPPQSIEPILPIDDTDISRVDGFRGLTDNFGSLYGVYDARGISPLFLDGLYQLQQPPFARPSQFEINPTFWELNAITYVYSGFEELPVDSFVITQGADRWGPVYLHQLANPRPFARLVYRADVVDSDEFARALLADPNYQPRQSIILHQESPITLPDEAPSDGTATITDYSPESFTLDIVTKNNAILSLAHPQYPGWQAILNGEPIDVLRAYGGFSAIAVPAGEHTLRLTYRPLSFRIGAMLSLVTWSGSIVVLLSLLVRRTLPNGTHQSTD